MPLHDMKCFNTECNHQDEEFVFIHQALPTTCPKCGKETYRKMYTSISEFSPHSCIFNGKWPEITPEAYAEATRQIAAEDRKNAELRRKAGVR